MFIHFKCLLIYIGSSCSKTEYAYAGILDDENQKLYPSNFFHLLSVHPIGFNNQQQQTGGYNTSNNEDLILAPRWCQVNAVRGRSFASSIDSCICGEFLFSIPNMTDTNFLSLLHPFLFLQSNIFYAIHGGAIERPIPARWLMGTWSELKIIQLIRRFFVMRIIDPMLNGWLEVVSTRERSIGGRSWKKQLRLEGEEEDCAYVTANLNSRETKWVLPLGFVEGSRERVCVFLEMMKEWQETVE